MAEDRKPLTLPPAAETDDNAVEMARCWIAEGGLHCVLNIGHWQKASETDERHAWGIMLADIARHVSNALEDVTGLDRRESLRMVVDSFNAEIGHATSTHDGQWPTMNNPAEEFWADDDP